jgi:hypothetical protein
MHAGGTRQQAGAAAPMLAYMSMTVRLIIQASAWRHKRPGGGSSPVVQHHASPAAQHDPLVHRQAELPREVGAGEQRDHVAVAGRVHGQAQAAEGGVAAGGLRAAAAQSGCTERLLQAAAVLGAGQNRRA